MINRSACERKMEAANNEQRPEEARFRRIRNAKSRKKKKTTHIFSLLSFSYDDDDHSEVVVRVQRHPPSLPPSLDGSALPTNHLPRRSTRLRCSSGTRRPVRLVDAPVTSYVLPSALQPSRTVAWSRNSTRCSGPACWRPTGRRASRGAGPLLPTKSGRSFECVEREVGAVLSR